MDKEGCDLAELCCTLSVNVFEFANYAPQCKDAFSSILQWLKWHTVTLSQSEDITVQNIMKWFRIGSQEKKSHLK